MTRESETRWTARPEEVDDESLSTGSEALKSGRATPKDVSTATKIVMGTVGVSAALSAALVLYTLLV